MASPTPPFPDQHPDDLWNELRRKSITRQQHTLNEQKRQNDMAMAAMQNRLLQMQMTPEPLKVDRRRGRSQTPRQLSSHQPKLFNPRHNSGSRGRMSNVTARSPARPVGLSRRQQKLLDIAAASGTGQSSTPVSQPQATGEHTVAGVDEGQQRMGMDVNAMVDNLVESPQKENRSKSPSKSPSTSQNWNQDQTHGSSGDGNERKSVRPFENSNHLLSHSANQTRGIVSTHPHLLTPLTRPRIISPSIGLPWGGFTPPTYGAQQPMPSYAPNGTMALHPIWGKLPLDHAAFTHVHVRRSTSAKASSAQPFDPSSAEDWERVRKESDISPKTIEGPALAPKLEKKEKVAGELFILNEEGVYRRRCAEAGFGGMRDVEGMYRLSLGKHKSRIARPLLLTEKDKEAGKERMMQDRDVDLAVGWLKDMGHLKPGDGMGGWGGVVGTGIVETGIDAGRRESEMIKADKGNGKMKEGVDANSWEQALKVIQAIEALPKAY